MKKIFFASGYLGDNGPKVVNRGYIQYLRGNVMHITTKMRALQFLELLCKIIMSKVVIFSGITSYDHITLLLCKVLNKKTIFIMHGWLKFEDDINKVTNIRGEKNEMLMLKSAHQILCVSKPFCKLIKQEFPIFSNKIDYLTNGINWESLNRKDIKGLKDDKSIVLLGGGRVTKRNLEVCKAVKLLNEKRGMAFHITVYGIIEKNDDSAQIAAMPYTNFHHVIPHEEILNVFVSSFLFVQNSDFEPFSLGVVEALACDCNILISRNVGARDVIPGLTDGDTITDTSDIEQIADKILYLSKYGNAKRLMASIDKEQTSVETASKKLYETANLLLLS